MDVPEMWLRRQSSSRSIACRIHTAHTAPDSANVQAGALQSARSKAPACAGEKRSAIPFIRMPSTAKFTSAGSRHSAVRLAGVR